MSDPVRLLSGAFDGDSDTSLQRELLASARGDHASLDAEERALAALGIGGIALAVAASAASAPALSHAAQATSMTTATTTASSFAPAGAPLAPVGAGALKITGLAFAKWVGVGVVAPLIIRAKSGLFGSAVNTVLAVPPTASVSAAAR